jgi:triacylglycerol esterase/lipase EstA (alpha/beta hydrolase family)
VCFHLTLLTISSIIAAHGLNPRSKNEADHAWDTWRKPAGPQGRLWLRDDLPQHVPKSRIFLYEYNSTAVYGKDRSTFIDKANEFLEAIRTKRGDVEDRPLLLLGHSLGGLLIKQALINAHNNPKYTQIMNATKGLAFFATPHGGVNETLVQLGGVVAKIAINLGFQNGDDVLETLKAGSIFTDIMHEHWRHQLLKYDIVSFWGALDDVSAAGCCVEFV